VSRLNRSEFEAFQHPEVSLQVRGRFVAAYLATADRDGDGALNVTEFLADALHIKGQGDSKWSAQAFDFRAEKQERLREFREDLDGDGDGMLGPRELAALLDPRHVTHAVGEAYDMFLACDTNGDHELAPVEFAACRDTLAANKMLHFTAWMRDEITAMYGPTPSRPITWALLRAALYPRVSPAVS